MGFGFWEESMLLAGSRVAKLQIIGKAFSQKGKTKTQFPSEIPKKKKPSHQPGLNIVRIEKLLSSLFHSSHQSVPF
jgi:hypothetical protein